LVIQKNMGVLFQNKNKMVNYVTDKTLV